MVASVAAAALLGQAVAAQVLCSPDADSQAAPPQTCGVQLPGNFYFGVSDLDWTGRERDSAALAVGFDMSGALTDRTQLSFSFNRGPANLVSAFTVANMYRTTVRAALTNPRWTASVGELTTAHNAIAGPSIRSDGASVSIRRRVIADLTVARPYDVAGSGGHLAQGRLGIRTAVGTFAFIGSDLARPSTSVPVAAPATTAAASEVSIGELGAQLQQLISRRSRLRGWGLESDLSFGQRGKHYVLARAGSLDVANQSGQSSHGGAGEARYTYKRSGYTFHAYGRHAPPSVLSAFVPGDAVTIGGRVPIPRKLTANVLAYWNVDTLLGLSTPIRSTGIIGGVQRAAGDTQFSLQVSERRTRSSLPQFDTLRRTAIGSVVLPFGPVHIDLRGEAGPAQRGLRRRTIQIYSATVNIDRGAWSVFAAGRYEDHAFQPPMARADAGASCDIRQLHVELGAGYGTGEFLGNTFGGWGKIEAPLARGFTLMTELDYFRWDYAASPYLTLLLEDPAPSPWRITFGIGRALNVPIPFARRAASESPGR